MPQRLGGARVGAHEHEVEHVRADIPAGGQGWEAQASWGGAYPLGPPQMLMVPGMQAPMAAQQPAPGFYGAWGGPGPRPPGLGGPPPG